MPGSRKTELRSTPRRRAPGVFRRALPVAGAGNGALAAIALVCGALAAGCASHQEANTWGDLEYRQADVRTHDEQVKAQHDLQADHSAMTDRHQPRQEKYFSQKMTEKQRQAFQQRQAKELYERAEKQRQEASRQVQQAVKAQQEANAKRLHD